MRFFRSDAATYEAARSTLDAAWGFPSDAAETCITPEPLAPHDDQGRVLLAVNDEFCGFDAVAVILPAMLSGGAVEELTEAEYWASVPVR